MDLDEELRLLLESYDEQEVVEDITESTYLEEGGNACGACLLEFLSNEGYIMEAAKKRGKKGNRGDKKIKLGRPTLGDVKKYKVFVRDPDTGNVVKVNFGDPNMEIRRDDPKRRKSFRARHKCHLAKDRTTPRYWSCKFWAKKSVSDLLKGK